MKREHSSPRHLQYISIRTICKARKKVEETLSQSRKKIRKYSISRDSVVALTFSVRRTLASHLHIHTCMHTKIDTHRTSGNLKSPKNARDWANNLGIKTRRRTALTAVRDAAAARRDVQLVKVGGTYIPGGGGASLIIKLVQFHPRKEPEKNPNATTWKKRRTLPMYCYYPFKCRKKENVHFYFWNGVQW